MAKKNKYKVIITKDDLTRIEKSAHHKVLKESGALDGRFKTKVVKDKKRKKIKHKGREFDKEQ